MPDPVPLRRPIRWDKLRRDEAERIIRERCKDTHNVRIGVHAYQRLIERSGVQEILQEDVYWILETGTVESDPVFEKGAWKVVVVKRMPGTRDAGAVTLFVRDDDALFVKTVEWMDWLR
jgi:hypothetical protein